MRLIDADALKTNAETIQTIDCWHMRTEEQAVLVEHIDNAPTIDAVPVVRCKDCKWYVRSMIKQDGTLDERYKPDWCDLYRKVREETYFCADGERKDDE